MTPKGFVTPEQRPTGLGLHQSLAFDVSSRVLVTFPGTLIIPDKKSLKGGRSYLVSQFKVN